MVSLNDLFFTLAESAMLYFMIDQFLDCRVTGCKKIIFLIAAIAIDTVLVNFLPLGSPLLKNIILMAVSLMIVQFLYKNRIFIKMFFILLVNYVFIISDIIAGNMLSWIYGIDIGLLISGETSLYILSKIIAFSLVLLYMKVFKGLGLNIPDKYWVCMDLIILSFIIIINFLMTVSFTPQKDEIYYSAQITGISVLFLAMSTLMIYIFGEICSFYQNEQQRYTLDLKNKALEQQLMIQKTEESDLKKIRHDIKSNLANISHLLNENHIEESVRYINSITSALESTKSAIHCGNNYLDAILNYEISVCKSNNIEAEFEIGKIPELNIDPVDLSSIFSNVLNNAIDANLKLINTERYINLKMFCYKNYLSAVIKNPYRDSLTESGGILATNKRDKLNHGYGLKLIKSSVERYDGNFKYSYENNIFTSMIILPLKSKPE